MRAEPGQLVVGAAIALARVAVAELCGQVELEPLGQAHGLGDRLRVLGEARRHRRRRDQGRAAVAAAARLGLLQRLPQPDRDEGILEAGAAEAVGVDVAGRHAGDAEAGGELGEPAVAGAVVAPVGPLQLDPEALAPEGAEQAPAQALPARRLPPLPGPRQRSVAGAAGEADEPRGVLLHLLQRRPGPRRGAGGVVACVRVGRGQQPAEIAVAGGILDQQREMYELGTNRGSTGRFPPTCVGWRPVGRQCDGQLGTRDRPQRLVHADLGELARAPDPVVVGEGEGGIAEGLGGNGELHRGRGAVEEREGRVRVQLDIRGGGCHQARCRYQRPLRAQRKTTAERPLVSASSK